MPPLYVPAVFTRQYTMLLVSPAVADSTIAYFVPAVIAYPVDNSYSYHVAVVVRLDATNVVLANTEPVGLSSELAAYRLTVTVKAGLPALYSSNDTAFTVCAVTGVNVCASQEPLYTPLPAL